MQLPGFTLQQCRRRLYLLDQQSARHHQQAGCRAALSGRCRRPLRPSTAAIPSRSAAPASSRSPSRPLPPPSARPTARRLALRTRFRAGAHCMPGAACRQDDDRHRRSGGNAVQGSPQPDAPRMAAAGTPHATEIVVRDGETISGLSQRYKVPADVIMKVNGLSATKGLKTGQKLVIPAYAYSSKGPSRRLPTPSRRRTASTICRPPRRTRSPCCRSSRSSRRASPPRRSTLRPPQASRRSRRPRRRSAKATGAAGTYTVQSGDTLSSIARKTGVGVVALKQANGMQDGLLKIGQTLKVPAGGTATVASAKPAKVDPVTTATTQPGKGDAVGNARLLHAAEEGCEGHPAGRGRRRGRARCHRHRQDALAGARPRDLRFRRPARTVSTSPCRRARRSRRPRTASSSMPATASRNSATRCWCATRTGWSPSTATPVRSRCSAARRSSAARKSRCRA